MIHKMVWSSVQFTNVQPLLAAKGIRSVAVDLPGYGMSDGPSTPPTAAEYANALLPILDSLGAKKAVFVGSDTGATIVSVMADLHPDRVERLILSGPPVFPPGKQAELLAENPFDQTLQPDGSHFTKKWAAIYRVAAGKSTLESIHQSVMQFFIAGPKEWYGHNAIFSYDLAPTLKRLRTPVLLITNRGDVLYDAARDVKKMRPDFAYREIDWNGINAIADDPIPWTDAVAAYLREKPSR